MHRLDTLSNACIQAADVTFVVFLVCLGEDEGRVMLAEGGGLFSLAGLEDGNTFAATGWFFFPDGSPEGPPEGPSARRFIPAIPPTAAGTQSNRDTQFVQVCNHLLENHFGIVGMLCHFIH